MWSRRACRNAARSGHAALAATSMITGDVASPHALRDSSTSASLSSAVRRASGMIKPSSQGMIQRCTVRGGSMGKPQEVVSRASVDGLARARQASSEFSWPSSRCILPVRSYRPPRRHRHGYDGRWRRIRRSESSAPGGDTQAGLHLAAKHDPSMTRVFLRSMLLAVVPHGSLSDTRRLCRCASSRRRRGAVAAARRRGQSGWRPRRVRDRLPRLYAGDQ